MCCDPDDLTFHVTRCHLPHIGMPMEIIGMPTPARSVHPEAVGGLIVRPC